MEQVVLRERVSFDSFTLDYDDRSLVVHYDQESLLGSATGVISGSRVEPHKKRIRLTSLTPTTNIPQLADAIMRSCTIIPPEQRSALVEALLELQHAGAAGAGQEPPAAPATRRVADVGPGAMGATSYSSRNREAPAPAVAASSRAAGVPTGSAARGSSAGGGKEAEEAAEEDVDEGSDDEPVRLADVDTYLEALYEDDMALKIAGAKRLLALAKMPANLPALIDNTTLLGALARVLREDWRKSGDLVLVLMQFFACMSHFSQLHDVLVAHRIGDLCMRVVELEHRRATARQLDMERFTRLAELQAAGDAKGERVFRSSDAEERAKEEQAAEAAAAALAARATAAAGRVERVAAAAARARRGDADAAGGDDMDEGGDVTGGGGSGGAAGADASGDGSRRIRLKPLPPGRIDIDKERRKWGALTRKQEALLFVCLSLLLNVAEDVAIERKMCKRNIVGLLTPLLSRDNPPLLTLVVAFLRKLSIFEENKDAMAALSIAPKLVALLARPSSSRASDVALRTSILRVIFNLTFDRDVCAAFLSAGILPYLTAALKLPAYRQTALKIMYHLSADPRDRAAFASTDAVSLVSKLVVGIPQPVLPPELAGLAVNLASSEFTAPQFCVGDVPRQLVTRVLKTGDALLMKVVRGMSTFTYAVQADECLAAAAAEEAAWQTAYHAQQQEQAAYRAAAAQMRGGADGGSRSRSRSRASTAEGKGGDEEDASAGGGAAGSTPVAAADVEGSAPTPPIPDEPIEYDYAYAGMWATCMRELLRVATKYEAKPEVCVEVMATLANMTHRDMPEQLTHADVLHDAAWIEFLERRLSPPGSGEEDVLLETIQYLGAAAADPECASPIAESNIPRLLSDVLAEKAADTDIMLQTCHTVLRLLHHDSTRAILVHSTRIPSRIVELLSSPYPPLVAEADECVHIMIEHDRGTSNSGVWQSLQSRRFQLHNREWTTSLAPISAGDFGSLRAGGRGGGAGGGAAAGRSASSVREDDDPHASFGTAGRTNGAASYFHSARMHENVEYDVSDVPEPGRRPRNVASVSSGSDDDGGHATPEYHALMNHYMNRAPPAGGERGGSGAGAVAGSRRATANAAAHRAVSGWETEDSPL